jgi:hypothetical protein
VFRILDPNGAAEFEAIAEQVGALDGPLRDLVFDAVNLVSSAGAFFRGVFPVETPYFWWGEAVELPWHQNYRSISDDGLSRDFLPIVDEVADIARALSIGFDLHGASPESARTYSCMQTDGSKKATIQGLAVETMHAVDQFLFGIAEARTIDAMPWLSVAYQNLIECTCQAQLILGFASVNARSAAMARHRENHAMKLQVRDWYEKHQKDYKSMDAAAEAAVEKIVPVKFRTARAWIGEWAKHLRSASTP